MKSQSNYICISYAKAKGEKSLLLGPLETRIKRVENVCTGCSLNIVFFTKTFEYSGLWSFSVLVSVCVHTLGRQNTSAVAKLKEFRIITKFSVKNTIFNEHPVHPTETGTIYRRG